MVVAVVDGHDDFVWLVRTRLKRVLPDAQVCTFTEHGAFSEFLKSATHLNLVILDETDLKKQLNELIPEIRAKFPTTPIILFSAKHITQTQVEKVNASIFVDKSKISDLVKTSLMLLSGTDHS